MMAKMVNPVMRNWKLCLKVIPDPVRLAKIPLIRALILKVATTASGNLIAT